MDGHTPREAAANATLRPKLIDLIRGLEGMYHKALKNGNPAYDPSWMWSELGLEDGSRPAYIPPLAERMLSADPKYPVSGHFLRVATVYLREEIHVSNRVLRVWLVFDTLGADSPHLLTHEIPFNDDSPIWPLPENSAPPVVAGSKVQDVNPLRALLHVVLNAILYSVSPGVERQRRKSPCGVQGKKAKSELHATVFSKEDVFFLPGAIEISRLHNFQQLERIPSGRTILLRFMVRGHWRRAVPGWKDQRMRWIAPYWKGPDIAAVIERTYKLKP